MTNIFEEIQKMIGHDPENLEVVVNRGNYKMYSTKCEPEYMIRVFNNNQAKQVQEKFIAEAHMLGVMFDYKQIPSPELVAAHLSNPEQLILIMEKIDGMPLHESWKYFSHSQRCDMALQVGKMIKELHKIKQQGYGIPNHYGDNWNEFLRDRINISLEILSPFLSEKLKTKTRSKSKTWLKELPDTTPVITHGDLNPHNIIIETTDDQSGISGIIDWEWAISAPSNYDLAGLESLFYSSYEIIDAFYDGYGSVPERNKWEYERKLYLLDKFLQNARYYVVTNRYTRQQQHLTRFMLSSILK